MELVLLFAAIVSMMMLTLFIFTYNNTIYVERLSTTPWLNRESQEPLTGYI